MTTIETQCEHLSGTGVDQNDGPDKVWRCDSCGWLYRNCEVEGKPTFVRVMRGVSPHEVREMQALRGQGQSGNAAEGSD